MLVRIYSLISLIVGFLLFSYPVSVGVVNIVCNLSRSTCAWFLAFALPSNSLLINASLLFLVPN